MSTNPFRLVLQTLLRVNGVGTKGVGACMRKCVLAFDVVDMTRRITANQSLNRNVLVGFLWCVLDIVHGSCKKNVQAIKSSHNVDQTSLAYLYVHSMYSSTKKLHLEVHRRLGMGKSHVYMLQNVVDDIRAKNIRIDALKTY